VCVFPTIQTFPLHRACIALAEESFSSKVEFVLTDLHAAKHGQPLFLMTNPERMALVFERADDMFISEYAPITDHVDHLGGNDQGHDAEAALDEMFCRSG
jgi:hypothetical protein